MTSCDAYSIHCLDGCVNHKNNLTTRKYPYMHECMAKKITTRERIAHLIMTVDCASQRQIAELLSLTQAGVSRHLRALGAIRVRHGCGYRYALGAASATLERRIADLEVRVGAMESHNRSE